MAAGRTGGSGWPVPNTISRNRGFKLASAMNIPISVVKVTHSSAHTVRCALSRLPPGLEIVCFYCLIFTRDRLINSHGRLIGLSDSIPDRSPADRNGGYVTLGSRSKTCDVQACVS